MAKAPFATQPDKGKPCPDPGEELSPHVNTQLFGEDPPPDPSLTPPMNGFVRDYLVAIREQSLGDRVITEDEYRIIMNCFTPPALPVLSGLARAFAVSDRWFCSVPSQTFCNRSFFHSGQSNGFVTNADFVKWVRNVAPTILESLSSAGVAWRVYFDRADVFPLTRVLHPALHAPGFDDNFRDFSGFRADCEAGPLPAYTFIEPRLLANHNDMHPPVLLNPLVDSSVLAGELLVNEVYVKSNPAWSDRHLRRRTTSRRRAPRPWGCPPWTPTRSLAGRSASTASACACRRSSSPFIEESSAGAVPLHHTTMIRTPDRRPLGARGGGPVAGAAAHPQHPARRRAHLHPPALHPHALAAGDAPPPHAPPAGLGRRPRRRSRGASPTSGPQRRAGGGAPDLRAGGEDQGRLALQQG